MYNLQSATTCPLQKSFVIESAFRAVADSALRRQNKGVLYEYRYRSSIPEPQKRCRLVAGSPAGQYQNPLASTHKRRTVGGGRYIGKSYIFLPSFFTRHPFPLTQLAARAGEYSVVCDVPPRSSFFSRAAGEQLRAAVSERPRSCPTRARPKGAVDQSGLTCFVEGGPGR